MASDRIVSARNVLDALSELKRIGTTTALEQLEQIEPDLASYLMEELGRVHEALLKLHAKPRITRRLIHQIELMTLVSVMALRNSQIRLWQEEMREGDGDEPKT